jgi:hypothetical protein
MADELLDGLTEEEKEILGLNGSPEPKEEEPSEEEEASEEPETAEETEETGDEETEEEVAASEEDDDEQGKKRDKKQKVVPHAALHAEREQRKAIAKQLEEERIARARLEERWKLILEQRKQQQEQEQEQLPDPELEPYDYMKHLGEEVQQLRQMTEQERQAQAQMAQLQQVIQHGEQMAAQYRAQVGPETYDKAFQHVYEVRGKELMSMGFNAEQVPQILQQEAQEAVFQAVQRGMNPGEMLMKIAQARGFNPEQSGEEGSEVAEKAKKIADGQRKTKGLGGAGKRIPNNPTPADLAKMSDEEFMEWYQGDASLKKAFLG